jgi:hypothetical protein
MRPASAHIDVENETTTDIGDLHSEPILAIADAAIASRNISAMDIAAAAASSDTAAFLFGQRSTRALNFLRLILLICMEWLPCRTT